MKKPVNISPIKEMEIRSTKIFNVVSLAQGIPSFDTPECIKKKAIEAINDGKTSRYSLSPGLLELREAIEYDLAKSEIHYDFEEEIIVTAGSIEAITSSFLALLDPGDEVLIPDPTYTSYQSAIRTARGVPVFAPLDESKNWSFDIKELESRITKKTKAILFCNPNNPTGTIYNKEQLLEILQLAEYHDLYVISDEVYRDFIYNDTEFISTAQFSDFRDRIIYVFSFSKAYAMTGWRVAFLATDSKIARKIVGVHDAVVTCAPVVSQWAALAALEMANEEVLYFKEKFIERKNSICRHLDKMGKWFSYIKPDSAYFVFPKFTEKLIEWVNKVEFDENDLREDQEKSVSWRFALKLLNEAGVAIVPGIAFGPSGENHIRLCFGREDEHIDEAMKRLKKYLEENCG
ncbi:MAG: pyridoxal phosphate-dependent aminotransferase [Patescibacteria group bacterium]|jgi:aminotransferase|nr:pyridoxal phosphate-dependent aminotransferase [Patescibacteria group bacterium]